MIYVYFFSCLIFLLSVSYVKSRKIINPVNVIGVIWLALLLISISELGGIKSPSSNTVVLVISSVFSMAIGSVFAFPGKKKNNDVIVSNKSIVNILFIFLCLLPVSWAFLNFLMTVASKGYLYYLYSTRIDGVERAIAAGGALNSTILAKVTRPIVYFYTFTALAFLILKGEKKLILWATLMLLMISVVFTSRADFLVLVVTIALFYFISFSDEFLKRTKSYLQARKRFLTIIGIGVLFFFWVSVLRSGGKTLYELFVHYVVNYHTVGFTLFDIAYNDPNSFLNSVNGYGLVSFSSIGFILQNLTGVLGLDYVAPGVAFRSAASDPVIVGTLLEAKDPYELNAFYTFMGPTYTDFGEAGVVLFAFLYGLFLMKSYLSFKKNRDIFSLTLTFFFLWTGYNSLLQSAISNDYWWFILVFILFFNKVRIVSLKR